MLVDGESLPTGFCSWSTYLHLLLMYFDSNSADFLLASSDVRFAPTDFLLPLTDLKFPKTDFRLAETTEDFRGNLCSPFDQTCLLLDLLKVVG